MRLEDLIEAISDLLPWWLAGMIGAWGVYAMATNRSPWIAYPLPGVWATIGLLGFYVLGSLNPFTGGFSTSIVNLSVLIIGLWPLYGWKQRRDAMRRSNEQFNRT